ncbi:MAG: CHAT domain-containing protein [Nostoc sp.]|uniref:CHAT domain-containing protein n=1 Tax=Nostoc sp. TaxID=1180 RepID=UPI002FFB9012
MVNIIQQITTNQNPQKPDVHSKEISPEELLQKQTLLAQAREATESPSEKVGEPFTPNLEQQFNKDTAILYIESEQDIESEEQIYRVRGYAADNDKEEKLFTEFSLKCNFSLSENIKSYNDEDYISAVQDFLGLIKGFLNVNERGRKRIGNWLIKIQERLKVSILVINDRTDSEIPWEMMKLRNKYLGTSLVTIRWQDVEVLDYFDENSNSNLIPLSFDSYNCSGDVVAYINTNELKEAEKDKEVLINNFNIEPFDNINNFLGHLEKVTSQISLMFISSHGFFSKETSQIRLGEMNNKKQNKSLLSLNDYGFRFFQNGHSIVFMNACHSGRLMKDKKEKIMRSDHRTGFATFFIQRGARGMIGTLDRVLEKYAVKVTKIFFDEYQRNRQLTVPAILKNIREEVVKNMEDDRTEENELICFSTFMYVYYGHPMTVLDLPSGKK